MHILSVGNGIWGNFNLEKSVILLSILHYIAAWQKYYNTWLCHSLLLKLLVPSDILSFM